MTGYLLPFLHEVRQSWETAILIVREGWMSSFPQYTSLVPPLRVAHQLHLEFAIHHLLIVGWSVL